MLYTLKRVVPSVIRQSVKNSLSFRQWRARDYGAPSPASIKQRVLLRNAAPSCAWVETGTYLGDTAAFHAVNRRISAVWGLAFLVGTVSLIIAGSVDYRQALLRVIVPFGTLIYAYKYTESQQKKSTGSAPRVAMRDPGGCSLHVAPVSSRQVGYPEAPPPAN